jgi:hypothetical protein
VSNPTPQESAEKTGPARFRPRPVEVTAIRWIGEANCADVFRFVGLDHDDWADDTDHTVLHLPTLDNPPAYHGDWLVKNQHGQVRVMRHTEFEAQFEQMPRPEPFDEGTYYHDSVDHLRRDLMKAHTAWFKAADQSRPEQAAGADPAQVAAYSAALMASSYSYTLAALIGYARRYGEHIPHALACVADDILMNGDDDNLNADVQPDAPAPAGAGGGS